MNGSLFRISRMFGIYVLYTVVGVSSRGSTSAQDLGPSPEGQISAYFCAAKPSDPYGHGGAHLPYTVQITPDQDGVGLNAAIPRLEGCCPFQVSFYHACRVRRRARVEEAGPTVFVVDSPLVWVLRCAPSMSIPGSHTRR